MPGSKRKPRIAVLPGDGIGPEVTGEALRVLDRLLQDGALEAEVRTYPFGAAHYLATGETMPPAALEELRGYDAILLGAIGDPRVEPGLLERAIVGGIRWGLDLYINLRPIKLYSERLCPLKGKGPDAVDMLCVRENTEDLYVGAHGFFKKGTPDEIATQEMILTRKGADRLFRYAFEAARQRPRKKLVLVDKANAVRAFDLYRRAFAEIAAEYPDVSTSYQYVDAACMRMVMEPEAFDVIVTSNVFGDILTDLGAMIQGGMGLAASANLHPGQVSMFEPIHGSAPDIAGQDKACPLAAILALGLLLDYVGEPAAAARVERAVAGALVDGEIVSATAASGLGTKAMTEIVLRRLAST